MFQRAATTETSWNIPLEHSTKPEPQPKACQRLASLFGNKTGHSSGWSSENSSPQSGKIKGAKKKIAKWGPLQRSRTRCSWEKNTQYLTHTFRTKGDGRKLRFTTRPVEGITCRAVTYYVAPCAQDMCASEGRYRMSTAKCNNEKDRAWSRKGLLIRSARCCAQYDIMSTRKKNNIKHRK